MKRKIGIFQLLVLSVFMGGVVNSQNVDLSPEILKFEPFVWQSETPEDCPFKSSEEFNGIKFLGIKSDANPITISAKDLNSIPETDGNRNYLIPESAKLFRSGFYNSKDHTLKSKTGISYPNFSAQGRMNPPRQASV